MLEKVVSAAPEFARAWAMVAWHRAFFLRNFDVKCIPGLNQSSVIAAADNALRLDPGAGDERCTSMPVRSKKREAGSSLVSLG
jgi:hypothetical protein